MCVLYLCSYALRVWGRVAAPLCKRAIPLVTTPWWCLILRVPPHAGLYLLRDLTLIAACVYAASHIGALPAWAAPLCNRLQTRG